MLENLLKELEKIKEIKAKKEFLKKSIALYKDKKIQERLKTLLKELEIEKTIPKKEESELEIRIEPNFTTPRPLEIEEAPKYEEAPDSPKNQDQSRGFSRLEELASKSNENAPAQVMYNVPRISETTPNPAAYRSAEDLRRELDNTRLNPIQHYISKSKSVEDISYNLQNRNEEDIRRSLENPNINQRQFSNEEEFRKSIERAELNEETFEKLEKNYNPDIIENLKRQKKHLHDKYLR